MFMHAFALFVFFFFFNIQASPPEIQPLDDAIVFLRDHSESTTVSNPNTFFPSSDFCVRFRKKIFKINAMLIKK